MGWLLLGDRDSGWLVSFAIAFENLSLGYGQQPAVRNVSAEIQPGSLTAVVGPNGAGKSTLLKAVAGSLSPLSGRVALGNTAQVDIAYLPQQSELDRRFPINVHDLVAMGLWHHLGAFGGLRREHRDRIRRAIATVGLTGLETRQIGSLSGGQLQRALFARLLLQNAKLVLLDEPFAAIDTRTESDLIEVIRVWHNEGRTVLTVLHDDKLVRTHFPDTLLLARELVAHGSTEQVLNAANLFRARQMCEACEGPPHTCGRDAA